MAKNKLIWQLYPSYLLITILSIMAATWFATRVLSDFIFNQTAKDLSLRAQFIAPQLLKDLDSPNPEAIDQFCKTLGHMSSMRITVILPGGKVVGDSTEDILQMDNHLDRPEITQAVRMGEGQAIRHSRTNDNRFLYVAVPIFKEGRLTAFVRAAAPLDEIDVAFTKAKTRIILASLLMAALAALLSHLVSRRITRPLRKLKEWSEAMASGENPSRSLGVGGSAEIASLAASIDRMATELRGRILSATRQRNEIEAILSSMAEGVIALDMDEHILTMNDAAGALFGWPPASARGRSIQEVVRNPGLQQFVKTAIARLEPAEKDLMLATDGERFLKVTGTILRDGEGKEMGVLVVLNDTTKLRQLENIRRDFVANVSHELKTPLTAIKGFVETLSEGALEDAENARRFLGIIEKHVLRLEAIIEDLLSLSRIEREAEKKEIRLQDGRLQEILQTAVQVCAEPARQRQIQVQLACPPDLHARVDPLMLEQAVVNLLDNAIKYSEPGKSVFVEGAATSEGVCIRVTDQGYGIPKEHLPRIFERFYRVDKARSRHEGGTGLGLAIVKHIVQAHGGRVSVESTPGKGSTFRIDILNPRVPPGN